RKESPYIIGGKKDSWVKGKNTLDIIGVIGGFTLRGNTVNALLVGLYDGEGHLYYIGHVGSGKLSMKGWRDLTEKLRPLIMDQKPFINPPERDRDTYWVSPNKTVKIKFTEWTKDGTMRQPTIESLM